MRKAVVLFNLGGPNKMEDVRGFLFNLFNDKNIIRVPNPMRRFIAYMISTFRYKKSGAEYAKMGGKSPIVDNTQAQIDAIQNIVGKGYDFYMGMRYNDPRTEEAVKKIKAANYDEVILMPMYPQFSTTTTKSSVEEFFRFAKKHKLTTPVQNICCYPTDEHFTDAFADLLYQGYQSLKHKDNVAVLFSAHGVPEKYITDGDPYEKQCKDSATKVFEKFTSKLSKEEVEKIEPINCFQSKVGPQKWLEPSTEHTITESKGRSLLLLPIAFTCEHLETLVELDMEYKEVADEVGVTEYVRIPTVSTHPAFIQGVADIITTGKTHCSVGQGECNAYCQSIKNRELAYNQHTA